MIQHVKQVKKIHISSKQEKTSKGHYMRKVQYDWKINNIKKMCQTIYPSREGMSYENLIALSSVNTVLGLVNISINIFLIYGLWKLNLTKKISYKFIVCLCIGDGCVGLMTQPAISVLLMADNGGNKCILDIATHSLQIAFCQYSVLMILTITMDRFLHMTYLTRYKSLMTSKRGGMLISINILITITFVLLNMIASIYGFNFIMHTTIIIINTIIFIIILIIYCKTYLAIRTRVQDSTIKRTMRRVINTSSILLHTEPVINSKPKIQYHQNFAKAMIFVLLTLAICYLPYFLLIIHISYSRFKTKEDMNNGDWRIAALYWSIQLIFINSAANAVIVIFSSKQLRRFAKNCLKNKRNANDTIPDRQRTSVISKTAGLQET